MTPVHGGYPDASQVALEAAKAQAAVATLDSLKYEWRGGAQWAPPLGQRPGWLDAKPFGFVTKTLAGAHHFYPDSPYLDNATECTTVYSSAMVAAALPETKITVDRNALYRVLQAIDGPGHLIRELQATRSLCALGHTNPIQTLIDEFNADSKKRGAT